MVHDLKSYKFSKVYFHDLEYLISNVELEINKLNEYSKYSSIKRILICLNEELGYLRAHKDKCHKIMTSKGKTVDESK